MNDRLKLNLRVGIVIGVLCIALIISYAVFQKIAGGQKELQAPQINYKPSVKHKTVTAKRADIRDVIEFHDATFTSAEVLNLYFKQSGCLKKIYCSIGDTVSKGSILAKLDTDSLNNQIKQQEIILTKTQLKYEELKASGGGELKLKQAQIDVELEKLKLDEIKKNLEDSIIRSPIDGVVASVETYYIGEYIDKYNLIIQVSNPRKLQLTYSENELDEGKMEKLELGNKVDITLSGGKKYKGVVVTTPRETLVEPVDGIPSVLVKVQGLPKAVEEGSTADMRLVRSERKNVIVVPVRAIHQEEERYFVTVMRNGIRKERDIQKGLADGSYVEVINGISEGDKVILR